MSVVFYKKPIELSSKTLRTILEKFDTYTGEVQASGTEEEQYEEHLSSIELLSGSIETIKQSRNALQSLVDKLQKEFDEAKSKSNKKDLTAEIEEIENEAKFSENIANANETIFILGTRITEARNLANKLARKLGKMQVGENSANASTSGQSTIQQLDEVIIEEQGSPREEANKQNLPVSQNFDTESQNCRSLKPEQIKLPRFHGDEEEFPEFWAIYDTMVHKSRSLSTIEKMLLLKDSLKGRAEVTIKGIQLIPQNYTWMIESLKKKYGNRPNNRAKIVQKLIDMPTAKSSAESCSNTFDNIRMLINHMISAGQDIRQMQDAMWTEKILEKFPYNIVKNVLVTIQSDDDVTIDEIMDLLEKEINAKRFVETRLRGHAKYDNQPNKRYQNPPHEQPVTATGCQFCNVANHRSDHCRTIPDIKTRREIIKKARKCWKCFSDQHASNECRKANCPKCGQMHDLSLCFTSENGNGHTSRPFSQRDNRQPSSNQFRSRGNYNPTSNERSRNGQNHGQRNESNDVRRRQPQAHPHTGENHSNKAAVNTQQQVERNREQIVLMTAEGNVWNNNTKQFEKIIFFFDTGAQRTIIKEQTATDLGLEKQSTELCTMSGIGGHTERFQTSIVPLKISTAYGKEVNLTVQTKPVLTNGFSSVRLNEQDKEFLQEKEICISNPRVRGEHQNPQILVGLDYYYELVNTIDTATLPSGLRLARTVFGPTVHGKGSTTELPLEEMTHGLSLVYEEKESDLLQKIFELDGLGISQEECDKDSATFEYFQEYTKSISFENGIVTVPFPLKDNVVDLADNYPVAQRRLLSLHRQLSNNADQKNWYCKILDDYIKTGVVEQVCTANHNAAGIYYMPHSGVWKPEKKKPLRVVFDASSKMKGNLSLNDVIYTGESFVNKIHDILAASRTARIILLCDIEAAFTQLRLLNDHKDLCRFLWLKNVEKPPTKDNIVEYRFNRLPFGNTASPSILNMAILAYLNHVNTPLSLEIAQNIYVDNILLCANSEEEALSKYTASKNIFQQIGMNLREYVSNSRAVNNAIPPTDRSPSGKMKFLGVTYDTDCDEFSVEINIPSKLHITKRDIVSQINSVYDPIGYTNPLTIKLKTLMREIYATGIDWKDKVPSQLANRWTSVVQEINNSCIRSPRPIFHSLASSLPKLSLWIFCDASMLAISTCAYVRCNDTGEVSQLISGKSKLTPKKMQQTIPRLELLAILIGLRMAKSLVETLQIEIFEVNVASDSEIALQWLNSSRKLPIFVSNQKDRISKLKSYIENKSITVHFFHVQTQNNPADVGTRGSTANAISEHDWVRGPRWLQGNQEFWPLRAISTLRNDHACDEAIDEEHVNVEDLHDHTQPLVYSIIDLSRISRYQVAIRSLARAGKMVRKWVDSCNQNRRTSINLNVLCAFSTENCVTASDMELSEQLIIAATHKNEDVRKLQQKFPKQRVIRDHNGIIRYQSRIQNANVPYDTKNPIYVRNDGELVRLIISDLHRQNGHCGTDHLLALARQRFWIPKPSRVMKKYVRTCITCRKCHGLPYGAPDMPPLPADRVVITRPFANVGCDYFGPFESINKDKMYICLYTCLTTRAVHLEVVQSLSTGAFLNSFIRFISRRGVPKLMRSDCGTNFKLGHKVLESLFDEEDASGNSIMNYSSTEGIRWIFNPPAAPWMGGVWERLVGSIKRCFQKSVGRKRLSFDQMVTAATRIEAIINTRPLTKPSSSDLDEIPLRPVDFLQGNLRYSLPDAEEQQYSGDQLYDPDLVQTMKQAHEAVAFSEVIATKFWERWNSEYLALLRDSQKQILRQPRHVTYEPHVGEIVLIEQELIPRGNWVYGRIVQLISSTDGLVRSVKIQTPNHHLIHRPLNKVYPLELRCVNSETTTTVENNVPPHGGSTQGKNPIANVGDSRSHLNRASKTRAREIIKDFERGLDETSLTMSLHHSEDHISDERLLLIKRRTMTIRRQSKESGVGRVTGNPVGQRRLLSRETSTLALTILACLSFVGRSSALGSNAIECDKGKVLIMPQISNFEICVDTICDAYKNSTEAIEFMLPTSALNRPSVISLRSVQNEDILTITKNCEPPEFCLSSSSMMSLRLIGNPHCWPLGALLSAAIIMYLLITLAMGIIWSVKHVMSGRRNARVSARTHSDRSSTAHPQEGTNMVSFTPTPLYVPSIVAMSIVLCTVLSTVHGCQHGYMRHNVDTVCTSGGHCTYQYNEEFLFNRVKTELCVQLSHANKTIGVLKLTNKPLKLVCSKVSQFYTRDTFLKIFHSTRCAQMGSCIDDKCDKIRSTEIVPELKEAAPYPGYSVCTHTCGGLPCECLLPFPACTFLRFAHIPNSRAVYEVVSCIEWKPLITVDVELTLYEKKASSTVELTPYTAKKHGEETMTVISLQKPHSPLMDRQFLISSFESFMLPVNYRLPVECESAKMASHHFANCTNLMICTCENVKSPETCHCPHGSFKNLRRDVTGLLPIHSSVGTIENVEDEIVASSVEAELTLAVESRILLQNNEFVVEQPCSIAVHKISGCYRCVEGANVTLTCLARIHSWTTIQCGDHVFSIECGPKNLTTQVLLDFETAVVEQRCHSTCSDSHVTFHLEGTLRYHPVSLHAPNHSIFTKKGKTGTLLHDLQIPDLTPLINLVKSEWKLAVGLGGLVLIIAGATYMFGPIVIVMILKYTFNLVKLVVTIAWTVIKLIIKPLLALMNIVCQFRNTDSRV